MTKYLILMPAPNQDELDYSDEHSQKFHQVDITDYVWRWQGNFGNIHQIYCWEITCDQEQLAMLTLMGAIIHRNLTEEDKERRRHNLGTML